MAINTMVEELFASRGFDERVQFGELVQKKFLEYLKAQLPSWQFFPIQFTSNNPRICTCKDPGGSLLRLDGITTVEGLPEELAQAIGEFYPTFLRLIAWWASRP